MLIGAFLSAIKVAVLKEAEKSLDRGLYKEFLGGTKKKVVFFYQRDLFFFLFFGLCLVFS